MLLLGIFGDQAMSQTPFTITASFPVDEGGLHHLIRLDETGRVDLVVENNADDADGDAIGAYRTEIGAERARELRDIWTTLSKRPRPTVPPVPPGAPMVMATLEEEGKKETWMIEPSSSPPAMCKAADHLRELGKEAVKKPLREIKMQAKLEQAAVEKSAAVKLVIQLSANGVEPVGIVDPLKAPLMRQGGFTFWGVRSDLPPADLWPHHSVHQLLTTNFLKSSKTPNEPTKEGELFLEPPQTAEYEFSIPVNWEPGEYEIRVIFETLSASSKTLRGKITSAPVKLKVGW